MQIFRGGASERSAPPPRRGALLLSGGSSACARRFTPLAAPADADALEGCGDARPGAVGGSHRQGAVGGTRRHSQGTHLRTAHRGADGASTGAIAAALKVMVRVAGAPEGHRPIHGHHQQRTRGPGDGGGRATHVSVAPQPPEKWSISRAAVQ